MFFQDKYIYKIYLTIILNTKTNDISLYCDGKHYGFTP
jgi:hypothetical protein